VYAFYGDQDLPLYVGRSVRVRQRLRSHLTGERRSSKDIRLAQQVRRVEWRATGGELGAMLAEAQWIAKLRPGHNRLPRVAKSDPADAPWPFEGPIVFEEREEASQARAFHVVDRWRYVGHAASLAEAAELHASNAEGAFELSTYRILQSHLARGLRVMPLGVSSVTPVANVA
jgi:DNA polymerase-3 subunit epsilon